MQGFVWEKLLAMHFPIRKAVHETDPRYPGITHHVYNYASQFVSEGWGGVKEWLRTAS